MKLFEALHRNNFTLEIDEALAFDETKLNATKRFIAYCIENLGLSDAFTVKFVENREAHGVKTTAFWREQDKLAVIYAKDRMLGDVLRSLAHELVHAQQWEQGRIELPVQDVGGEIEDEANAMAGVLIKKFSYDDPMGKTLFV
jgi:hypothetical protein